MSKLKPYETPFRHPGMAVKKTILVRPKWNVPQLELSCIGCGSVKWSDILKTLKIKYVSSL
jgi:hypothetical protein